LGLPIWSIKNPSEIISYWHPARTGTELVDAQSAIRYFNLVLAFAQRSVFHGVRNQGNAVSANWRNGAIISWHIWRAKHSVAVEPSDKKAPIARRDTCEFATHS
jgi:hypothetical protein